jgi:regulatory protein
MENSGDRTYANALNSALRILARRDHSVVELVQKLTRRGYEEDVIHRVVAGCSRLGYLDDERAAGLVIDRMQRKGMGVRRIRYELQQRGLEGERAEAQLRSRVTPAEERSQARRAALRKWETLAGESDPQKKRLRLQRFLRYRGFPDSMVFEMLKEMDS